MSLTLWNNSKTALRNVFRLIQMYSGILFAQFSGANFMYSATRHVRILQQQAPIV